MISPRAWKGRLQVEGKGAERRTERGEKVIYSNSVLVEI